MKINIYYKTKKLAFTNYYDIDTSLIESTIKVTSKNEDYYNILLPQITITIPKKELEPLLNKITEPDKSNYNLANLSHNKIYVSTSLNHPEEIITISPYSDTSFTTYIKDEDFHISYLDLFLSKVPEALTINLNSNTHLTSDILSIKIKLESKTERDKFTQHIKDTVIQNLNKSTLISLTTSTLGHYTFLSPSNTNTIPSHYYNP